MPNPENIEGQGFHTDPERINKEGRPKGSRNRSTIARKWLEVLEKVKNPITQGEEELTQEEIMTLAQISKARKGDTKAYQALMDSAFGAPKNQTELTTDAAIQIIQAGKPDDH